MEHPFILQALQLFGFGEKFKKSIEKIRKPTVQPPLKMAPHLDSTLNGILNKVASLFLMAAELLAIHIKNSNIAQLRIFNEQIIISQLADDTAIFLIYKEEICAAIKLFSKSPCLTLNVKKIYDNI